ncbi:MAG: PLP-dependent transferase, partial [Verrucomicrobiota bacterium]|nr:PLP-dependent transferase [Verrucomicrobiota bacterium]
SSTPLLVDDTVCSHLNVDTLSLADAVSTSLTKWVSGVGDVLAGGVRLNRSSAFADELRCALDEEVPGGSRIYPRDGETLIRNSADFRERVVECNRNGLEIAEFLHDRAEIAEVWYPALVDRLAYDALRRADGGYGGLVSFTLKNQDKTPEVYRAMRFSKGPSLGTDYSLLCPYTLLAHYSEIPWAGSCGVSAKLLRLSVGREPVGDLLARLDEALRVVG